MNLALAAQLSYRAWSPRGRLYGGALVITLCYLLTGRLLHADQRWVEVDLPLSSASVLLLGLSAAEMYLYVQRMQRRHRELEAERAKQQEEAERQMLQRQNVLQEISRALIDNLDLNRLPAEALDHVTRLFQAEVVAIWVADKNTNGQMKLRGITGQRNHTSEQLDRAVWSFPGFQQKDITPRPLVTADISPEAFSSLAGFCAREAITAAALAPIIRRAELAGLVGVFYRTPPSMPAWLTTELQTLAHLLASAIQAEELYRDLVQVQKVQSIGTLASGIAHDFNNVLAAILACASYVKQQTDPANPSYRYLEAAEASAHRGAALTKQLLAFARREGPRLVVLNPNDCIEQTLKMIERSFDKSILIQRQYAADLRPVEADPSQLEQIILNIAVNARDAMPEGGIFTITTRNVQLDRADRYRPAVALPDGAYVALGFRDMGSGMDEVTLKRIFEPFFTTKRPGKGTGLGLSVVDGIVKGFGGAIRVESAPGKGTLFEVFLPVTDKPLPAATADNTVALRGGNECILIAEDEDIIREMAQLTLEGKGYKVMTAPDGAAALACYRQHWKDIGLVIADMVMPRMSGPELLAHVREVNPNARVIVSSGYSHDLEGERMLRHGCLGYLQKPYNPDALCQLVRSVLDSGL
jgi:signal transduction histidine kinase/ActR/RegA family two-component response regulator